MKKVFFIIYNIGNEVIIRKGFEVKFGGKFEIR